METDRVEKVIHGSQFRNDFHMHAVLSHAVIREYPCRHYLNQAMCPCPSSQSCDHVASTDVTVE